MADDRTDPLADIFTLFAAPLAGAARSFDQFRKGVDEFLRGVENFNRTMEHLNETSERINALLTEIEPPLRAAIPQVTRTVQTADQVMRAVSGPAMAVAPGLHQLADTLSTPAFAQLPAQITQFSEVLGEVSKRLSPLTTFAESAGGLFGGFRMPGTRTASVAATPPSAAADEPAHEPVPPTKPAPHRQAPAKKSSNKKPAAKKPAAKKAPAKKAPAKKAPAKKAPAKKAPAKK